MYPCCKIGSYTCMRGGKSHRREVHMHAHLENDLNITPGHFPDLCGRSHLVSRRLLLQGGVCIGLQLSRSV